MNTSGYFDNNGNWVWRSELEETFLHVGIRCKCNRPHKQFPPSCVREEYKEIIKTDLASGLLSNFAWIRELATEIAKEQK